MIFDVRLVGRCRLVGGLEIDAQQAARETEVAGDDNTLP